MDFKELENMTDEQLMKVFPVNLRYRLYRFEERENVAEDIRNWMFDNRPEYEVDEADVLSAAGKFHSYHDCTLPYWSTIEMLVDNHVANNPRLTQKEIDQIRCDLSNAKEDNWDEVWGGESEDASDEEHSRWMEESWSKFDELKLADVYSEDEDYTHGIVGYAIDNDYTVGDFYDLLSRVEKIINS